MALRVPAVEMQDEALAVRLRRVVVGILHVGRAEHLLTAPPLAQLVGVVDGVPGLVAQDLHAPLGRAAFDLEHLRALELLEAGMRQVERDRHARDAVGREPLGRQPEMRLEPAQPAGVELGLQLLRSAARARCPRSPRPDRRSADPAASRRASRPTPVRSPDRSAHECSEFAGRTEPRCHVATVASSTSEGWRACGCCDISFRLNRLRNFTPLPSRGDSMNLVCRVALAAMVIAAAPPAVANARQQPAAATAAGQDRRADAEARGTARSTKRPSSSAARAPKRS